MLVGATEDEAADRDSAKRDEKKAFCDSTLKWKMKILRNKLRKTKG